jgi:hypothetical protein
VVEKIEPSQVVDALIANAVRQKLVDETVAEKNAKAKDDLVTEMLAVRNYAVESITEGLTGN